MDERTMALLKDYADEFYVPHVRYELIPVCELICDQNYQRELSKRHVKCTSENFDPVQINPVKVSHRDGKYYVINGQHTIEIVARVSGSRETPVWCMIYDDLEYEREAGIFANQMKYVRALTPYEIFNARIEAGDPDSHMIKTIIEAHGLILGNEDRPGTVRAIKTLEEIYYKMGIDVLSRVLRVCINTWDGDGKSLASNMLKGLAILFAAYDDRIKDEVFIDKLGVVSIKELTRTAKDRKAGPMGFAEAMLICYNKKSRAPLPYDIMYKYKSSQRRNKGNDREKVIDRGLEKVERYKEDNDIIDGFVSEGEIIPAEPVELYQNIMMGPDYEQREEPYPVQT